MTNSKTISISTKNFDKLTQKIKNPQIGCNSVDEYVEFILNEILESEQNTDEISEDETKRVQEELKKMGYI